MNKLEKLMKKYLLSSVLLSLLFLSCSQNSFKQNLQLPTTSNSLMNQIDTIVINKMNEYNIPGLSIGIVKNNKILYTKGYGVISIESKELVTENSIFHTASISKLFTAQAIVQLTNNNQLSLEDKLIALIPELQFSDSAVKEITIKSLLNHTSGLPDVSNYYWSNNNQSDTSLRDYILDLDVSLESNPNTEYYYSNLGYDILGYVVEKVSGMSFEDFVRANILDKSGMLDSDFRYFKIPDSLRTAPHTDSWLTGNVKIRDTYPYTREHAPSSTLNASSIELSNWMLSFMNSLEDSNSQYDFSSMIYLSTELSSNIGLGFQLYDVYSKKAIGHYGGDRGFRSFLMMIPEDKIGIVLLANCDYNEDFRQEIVYPIVKLILN